MPANKKSEQIVLMQQMVDMAAERTKMATERTAMATDRTDMADERTKMAAERTDMASERTRMAAERTKMASERTRMAAERTYMAAERTLSVWVRTALGLMVFGIAIDRFGLLLRRVPSASTVGTVTPNDLSAWGGMALIVLSVVMVVATGLRFLAYAVAHRRKHDVPLHHGPYLAPGFALLVALFGVALLILLLVVLA